MDWLDKAIDAYYRGRIYSLLNQVETQPQTVVLKAWTELLTEMYGDETTLKNELVQTALTDNKVSQAAKNRLKQLA